MLSDPITFTGHIFAPGHSEKHVAELTLEAATRKVTVKSESYLTESALEEISLSDEIGKVPRRITFPSGWVFIAIEGQQLNSWLKQHAKPSMIAKLEKNLGLILISVLITALTAFAGYRYGLPLLANAIADALPSQVAEYVGENTQDILDDIGMEPSTLPPARQAKLQNEFDQTLAILEQSNIRFEIRPKLVFKHHQDDANAFALADGSIILTDAMVRLAESPEEREGIFLHELGHVYHKHVLTNLVQSTLLSITVAMVIGDSSSIGDTLVSVAVLGAGLSYSRELEKQADTFAADQLIKHNQPIDGLIALYNKLKQEQAIDLPSWISTHPELEQRITDIKAIKKQKTSE